MDLWPHQTYGITETLAARAAGCKRICLTSPTGGGKTEMVQRISQVVLAEGRQVALYCYRIMMVEQISNALAEAGILHGVRAAGQEDLIEHPFQVCSFQTETSRVLKQGRLTLHATGPGDLAVIDEGHLHVSGKKELEIRRRHIEGGATTLDVTATPLGMGAVCDRLIVAGKQSELRKCGALTRAVHYGCDEPDLRAFKKLREGEDPSQAQQRKAIMTPSILGRVWKWFEQLNPERRPTLLFGPGVDESLWFAEQFSAKGVRAAHIDGADVWLDGKLYRSSPKARENVRNEHRDGRIPVVCNRYVLREGIDWPWVQHMILAFVAGSLQTYLQIGGRGLRAYPGKECVVIQDHGGSWWKHGSLNEDREWSLDYTPEIAFGLRADRLRLKRCRRCRKQLPNAVLVCPACKFSNDPTEPRSCPKCGMVWGRGLYCDPDKGGCGERLDPMRKSRPVVSVDGEVRELSGDVFNPRRVYRRNNGPAIWERMYWRSRTAKGERTFKAAMALFAQENHWGWPDLAWPFMPVEPLDFYRLVADVPFSRLRDVPAKYLQEQTVGS